MQIKGYHDTLAWYEKNAAVYAQKTQTVSASGLRQLKEFISHLPAKATILDAGCGGGMDTNYFQQKGFEAVGIDITNNLIKEAKKSYPQCTFQQADILDLPFANQHFDGVWAHASLVHFDQDEQIERAVNELIRVLKKGGILHLLVRAKKTEKRQILIDSLSKHPRFYRNFTQDEVKTLIAKHNLKLLSLSQYDESKVSPAKRPGEGIEWIVAVAKK